MLWLPHAYVVGAAVIVPSVLLEVVVDEVDIVFVVELELRVEFEGSAALGAKASISVQRTKARRACNNSTFRRFKNHMIT
jgi:hypothetical protein